MCLPALVLARLFAQGPVVMAAFCFPLLGGVEPSLLDLGYRQMYKLQFEEAHRSFARWQTLRPEDALGPASDAAAYLFSEFDRLHILQSEFFTQDDHFITDRQLAPDPALKLRFEAALATAGTLAARSPQDPNALFAALLCHGLRSDYLALIEKQYKSSFGEMKRARTIAEKLLLSSPDYYDAWLAIGMENYMLGVKPLVVRWILRWQGAQTDRAAGLAKLRLTAERGRYLAPLARLMLAVAALRDHDTNRARDLLAGLSREFPGNPLYRQELARLVSH
jgi:hypothetical protein